ncbi:MULTISPECIES: hypothetical protein [unclassified Mesorhizobium]|uniref:hypothetical protein n=1 Tax=unclassified Mesorhizobium TaxID=325217 RepID=UPI000FCC7268|nr:MULTISPECIES: hypothetical protein [unclassified Mesorhizobium]RUV24300.1 hypothetical protein EOA91_12455 [Mesorhizobium sp. M1A.F.Ca.IN.022.04.1.1]RWG30779.1 MAG: hypothetical protein EOQ60_18055 [Mesorhizobium sp.]
MARVLALSLWRTGCSFQDWPTPNCRAQIDGRFYEFHHHQFQEWYASKAIERELVAHGDAPFALADPFVSDRLNDRRWEEAILFACERMSRENASAIVARVVLVVLELDPMLAAAIIRRGAEAVWDAVSASILDWVRRWHAPQNADRAITFMIETGRPDFADLVWPVVTNVNSQVRLGALRGGGSFDMAVLGQNLDRNFSGLTEEVRESVISELIHYGGIEEEEKAAALAGRDPRSEVRIRAIESLLFEGAVEAAEALLRSSWGEAADAIARRGYTEQLRDPDLVQGLEGLRRAAYDEEADPLRKAGMAVNYLPVEQQPDVIEQLLSDPATDLRADQGRTIADIAGRHPHVVDRALRNRVEHGSELPWRFEEDYLIYGRTVDDGPVHDFVTREDLNSDASRNAATLAGPQLVKTLFDRYLAAHRTFRATGVRSEAAYAPVKQVAEVLGRVQREVLLSVVSTYAALEDAEDIKVLSHLLSSQQDRRRPDPVSESTLDGLAACLDTWAHRLLSAASPDRNALGELAGTMKRFPHPAHVHVLREMLTADLALYRTDVAVLRSEPGNQPLRQRVQVSYAWSYRDALSLVGTEEAEAVLSSFLLDELFGPDAAIGLVRLAAPGTSTGPFTSRNERVRANTNRLRRTTDPAATSPAGQAIFEAVRNVFGEGNNLDHSRRAASIAALGVLIPHGDQSDILELLLRADLGTRVRQHLLTNMGEGGYVLRADDINAGLRELLDLAATEPWQLGNDHYVLREWLALYALSDRPRDLLPAIGSLPNTVRFTVWGVRDLLPALKSIAPGDLSAILIGLVRRMPELRSQHEFYDATLMLPVQEICSLLEATAGPLGPADLNGAAWDYADRIARQLSETDIKWLEQGFADASSPTRRLQGQILAACGTEEIFVFLAADPLGRDVVRRSRTMRMSNFAMSVVSENTSDGGFVAREVQPADCSSLRRALFHMAIGQDAAQATFGKECLTNLDSLRDEDGTVETEPRHPDISAGQPWPIVPPAVA